MYVSDIRFTLSSRSEDALNNERLVVAFVSVDPLRLVARFMLREMNRFGARIDSRRLRKYISALPIEVKVSGTLVGVERLCKNRCRDDTQQRRGGENHFHVVLLS